MAEEEERELRLPLLVGRVLDILPTKSLGDPWLLRVWRDGASRPAALITASMGPLEGGPWVVVGLVWRWLPPKSQR